MEQSIKVKNILQIKPIYLAAANPYPFVCIIPWVMQCE